jgi:hypothetical protein
MTHIPLPENSPFNRLSPLIGGRIVGGVGTFLRIALSTPVAALLYLVTGSPANAPGPEDEIE